MPDFLMEATTMCLRGYITDHTPRDSLIKGPGRVGTRFPPGLNQVSGASAMNHRPRIPDLYPYNLGQDILRRY